MAKIAPSVQAWMAGKATADDVLHGEIRALLAVARAARPIVRAMVLLTAPSNAELERLIAADRALTRTGGATTKKSGKGER